MKVSVTEYNRGWPDRFAAESRQIREALGEEIVAIHHIGSTFVPGLKAKPIIDILLVVKDVNRLDRLVSRMIALAYRPMGEFGIPGRRYFAKGTADVRTHNVHAFGVGSTSEIERHLAVRDYLRTHPAVAAQYGELKARLAEAFPEDIEAYMDGKDAFVKEMERNALKWRAESAAGSCPRLRAATGE